MLRRAPPTSTRSSRRPSDGMYEFPSVTGNDPVTGKPTTTNCTICNGTDSNGLPMLPAGKYVVEMIVPPGYELVKEEDKNILIGDNYIAPVTQQFGGLGSIFILPDQAEVGQVNPAIILRILRKIRVPSRCRATKAIREALKPSGLV